MDHCICWIMLDVHEIKAHTCVWAFQCSYGYLATQRISLKHISSKRRLKKKKSLLRCATSRNRFHEPFSWGCQWFCNEFIWNVSFRKQLGNLSQWFSWVSFEAPASASRILNNTNLSLSLEGKKMGGLLKHLSQRSVTITKESSWE